MTANISVHGETNQVPTYMQKSARAGALRLLGPECIFGLPYNIQQGRYEWILYHKTYVIKIQNLISFQKYANIFHIPYVIFVPFNNLNSDYIAL